LLLAIGIASGGAGGPRTFRAVRTDTPPVIDGSLDDACWQQSEVAGDFRRINEGTPALEASEARLLYDDTNLYFGFRCAEPQMDLVRRDLKANPSMFDYERGNTVEIFFDPGRTKRYYWQFMINTNGVTEMHLSTHDVMHLGDLRHEWQARVFLGDDFFSIEAAAPFALLHPKPNAGRMWGVNFCRARQIGRKEPAYMYSSWQPMRGGFLFPEQWGTLHIDADLSRFCYAVVAPEVIRAGEPFHIKVTNLTGEASRVKLTVQLTPLEGKPRSEEATLSIDADESATLDCGVFSEADSGADIRVTIADAGSGERLFVGATQTIEETENVK